MNAQETKAISKLKEAARIWPKSLWLFSANGNLYVMRKTRDGGRYMTSDGGIDQVAIVDQIRIENDGGDW